MPICPCHSTGPKSRATESITKISRLLPAPARIGMISAASPRISPILAILEPITLPNASPGAPSIAARTETRSSGKDVPNPTIVSEMRNAERPRRAASPTAPLTSQSPPKKRPTSPASTRKYSTFAPKACFPRDIKSPHSLYIRTQKIKEPPQQERLFS